MGGWPLGESGIWLIWRRVYMETLWIPTQGKMQRTWCVLRGHQTATFVAPTSLQTHLRVTRWLWNPFFDPLRKQPMIAKPTFWPTLKKTQNRSFCKNPLFPKEVVTFESGFWENLTSTCNLKVGRWVLVAVGQQFKVGRWVFCVRRATTQGGSMGLGRRRTRFNIGQTERGSGQPCQHNILITSSAYIENVYSSFGAYKPINWDDLDCKTHFSKKQEMLIVVQRNFDPEVTNTTHILQLAHYAKTCFLSHFSKKGKPNVWVI